MAAIPKFADNPLGLAERISADQHAARGIGVEAVEQAVDLAARVRMAKNRQAKRGLGDEDVARRDHERRAGRVRAAFVIARHDHSLAIVFEDDLRGAEHMAGWDETDIDLANPDRLSIADRLPARLRPIAALHDRQGFGRRQHFAMATARVVAMAVRDKRERLGLRRIDPGVRGADVDPFGVRLDPGTETGHCELYR